MTNVHDDLSRSGASEYLWQKCAIRQSVATLARKAVYQDGPEHYHVGKFPRYSTASLDAWARGQFKAPDTSRPRIGEAA